MSIKMLHCQMLQSELHQLTDPMFSGLASVQSVGQIPILILPDFTVKMQKTLIIEIICEVRQNANRTVLLSDNPVDVPNISQSEGF
jgi:hypothetical protein